MLGFNNESVLVIFNTFLFKQSQNRKSKLETSFCLTQTFMTSVV